MMAKSSTAFPRSCLPTRRRSCLNLLRRVRSWHCGTAAWACAARHAMRQLPTGLRGRTPCRPSPSATPTLHVRSPAPSRLTGHSRRPRDARDSLSAVGFGPPAWAELLHAQVLALPEDDPSLDPTRGWHDRRPKQSTSFAIGLSCGRPIQPRPPCWIRRPDLTLRAFSPRVPPCRSSPWSRPFSGSYCSADSGCRCR